MLNNPRKMVNERVICCCGASSWTQVFAWFQIVGNSLMLFLTITQIAAMSNHRNGNIWNKGGATAELAFGFAILVFGIVFGVLLLKGTKQKRVSYIKAWLIYVAIMTVVSIIQTAILSASYANAEVWIFLAILLTSVIGMNLFCFIVVYTHMKEIIEGNIRLHDQLQIKWNAMVSLIPTVIAWFQIIGNSLMLLLTIIDIAVVASLHTKNQDIANSAVTTELAFAFMILFFGIFIGVLLLKGTKQKRVSYIKAWLIYGVTAFVVSIITVILNASSRGADLLMTGMNLFCVNEGVYIP